MTLSNLVAGKAPLLAVSGIDKRFPGVHALKSVSFDVRRGEIHALVGENGAGKSTLMRVLSGVYQPDSGQIVVDGQPVVLRSPADGFALGLAMVYQDTRLVPTLDVAWNIALGHEPGGAVLVDRARMLADARAVLARVGCTVDPARLAGDLTRAEMQQVEIARALARQAQLLILDEPTSALTPTETEALFAILHELRAVGTGIIFISHRIPEVLAHADRITVMKDGVNMGTVPAAGTTPDALVAMMVGRPVGLAYPARAKTSDAPVLRVQGLTTSGASDVSFTLHRGEILGFGGVQGAGQQDTARALFGLGRMAGQFSLDGRVITPRSPAEASAEGIIYVPADRRGESLFGVHSIRENAALPHLGDWARGLFLNLRREAAEVDREARRLDVKAPDWETQVANLSGGNQQKVVFARWFLGQAKVFVLDEPTQGVDVETKMELYRLIRALAQDGAAVIVISSDLVELIGLTDRILVFADGAVVADLPSAEATEASVIGAAVRAVRSKTASTAMRKGSAFWSRQAAPLMLLALIAALVIGTSLVAPYFLTSRNFASMAGQVAPLAIAALGQMATILLGGIDLSVGPTISLITAVASYLLATDSALPPLVGLIACLGIGAVVGALNGALIVGLRIPDLVATLATFSVVQGLALIVRPAPGGTLDPEVAALILQRWFGVPAVFVLALGLFLIAGALLARGRIGARLYATGASPDAAAVVGIPTGRVRFAAYLFSGVMAALAGLIIAARIGSGDPQAGGTFTLASVTAVVVGGTSVFGGSGTASGTFLGAALIILLQNVLNQLQVSAYWQYVWTGVLTLLAVGFHSLRTASQRKATLQRLRQATHFSARRKRGPP
jgi:ribose transport system ATP-binding protein